MSIFEDIEVSADVAEDQTVRESQAWLKESGAYKAEVAMFRFGKSSGGANFFQIDLKTDEGKISFGPEYFTSGDAKDNRSYYTDKDGNKKDLPGLNKLKAISRAIVGDQQAWQKAEEAIVPIYDFNAKTEVDQKVPVFKAAVGQKIGILVQRVLEDATALNTASGKYEPNGKTKAVMDIVAWVDTETNQTRSELEAGKDANSYKTFMSNIAKSPVYDKRKVAKDSPSEESKDTAEAEEAPSAFA